MIPDLRFKRNVLDRRSWARRAPLPVAIAALAVGAAACSGSSASLPPPGHGSPGAAISGFIQGLENNNVDSACSYAAPNEQSQCKSGFTGGVSVKQSGLGLGNTFTDGNQAIVVLEASSFCFGAGSAPTTTTCFSNTDPNKDLPTSDSEFQSALSTAFNGSTNPLSAAVNVDGQWYAELQAGGGAAGTGTTGATGTTGTSPTTTGATGTTGTSPTTTGTTGTSPTTTGATGTTGT